MFSFIFLSVHFSSLVIHKCVVYVGLCEPLKCSWQRVKSPACPPAAGRGSHAIAILKEPSKSFAVVDRCPLWETKGEGHILICRFEGHVLVMSCAVFRKLQKAYMQYIQKLQTHLEANN